MKRLLIPISALFLAACGAANAPADVPVEVNSDTVLDDQLFQEATSSNNLAKCDEIVAAAKKDDCKMVVNSFLITNEAVTKLDASLCEDITEERYRENCENQVNNTIADKGEYEKKLEDAKKLEKEVLAIETEAIEKKDINICEQISDSRQRDSCKYNVVSETDDLGLCDKIEEDSLKELCKSNNFTPGN